LYESAAVPFKMEVQNKEGGTAA
jgi:hypothetical protein